mmetsp:Transcript_4047/g.12995  ORF Transcript_4047/g.12995 Transcript_4047/m.12995 type:complete len:254 (+) Transcript_4047:600-1361(+)
MQCRASDRDAVHHQRRLRSAAAAAATTTSAATFRRQCFQLVVFLHQRRAAGQGGAKHILRRTRRRATPTPTTAGCSQPCLILLGPILTRLAITFIFAAPSTPIAMHRIQAIHHAQQPRHQRLVHHQLRRRQLQRHRAHAPHSRRREQVFLHGEAQRVRVLRLCRLHLPAAQRPRQHHAVRARAQQLVVDARVAHRQRHVRARRRARVCHRHAVQAREHQLLRRVVHHRHAHAAQIRQHHPAPGAPRPPHVRLV